jgi:hypothetical protein
MARRVGTAAAKGDPGTAVAMGVEPGRGSECDFHVRRPSDTAECIERGEHALDGYVGSNQIGKLTDLSHKGTVRRGGDPRIRRRRP